MSLFVGGFWGVSPGETASAAQDQAQPCLAHQACVGPDTWEIIMSALAVQVQNADRMMTQVRARQGGLEVVFADGRKGLVPFLDIPEVEEYANLAEVSLPNPFEVILRNRQDEVVELPWDFVRHYCDVSYQPRVESIASAGRQALGRRIRQLRETARVTQEELSAAAGVGRVTLVRIETGQQSPRYETLAALAKALGRPLTDLLVDQPTP